FTEMDVAIPVNKDGNPSHPEDLVKQAEVYREIAEICAKNPACTALQTWGFTDKYSWIGWYTNHTKGDALLFDRHYQPSPLTKPYARCWYIRLPPEAPGNPNDCGSPELQYALPSRTLNPRCGL